MEIVILEHHAVMKFLSGGGCTATVIHICLVTLYSGSSLFNEFKCGHQSLEGDPCSGQPSDVMN